MQNGTCIIVLYFECVLKGGTIKKSLIVEREENKKTCISENVPSLAVKKQTYYLSVYHPRSKKLFTVIQQLQTLLCNFYPTTRGWNFHKVASIQRQYSLLVGMLRTYISTQSLSQAWHHTIFTFRLRSQ